MNWEQSVCVLWHDVKCSFGVMQCLYMCEKCWVVLECGLICLCYPLVPNLSSSHRLWACCVTQTYSAGSPLLVWEHDDHFRMELCSYGECQNWGNNDWHHLQLQTWTGPFQDWVNQLDGITAINNWNEDAKLSEAESTVDGKSSDNMWVPTKIPQKQATPH